MRAGACGLTGHRVRVTGELPARRLGANHGAPLEHLLYLTPDLLRQRRTRNIGHAVTPEGSRGMFSRRWESQSGGARPTWSTTAPTRQRARRSAAQRSPTESTPRTVGRQASSTRPGVPLLKDGIDIQNDDFNLRTTEEAPRENRSCEAFPGRGSYDFGVHLNDGGYEGLLLRRLRGFQKQHGGPSRRCRRVADVSCVCPIPRRRVRGAKEEETTSSA